MAPIKPRPANVRQSVKLSEKITQKHYELLHAYARYLGEDLAYVLNELIGSLGTDKDFVAWQKVPANAAWKPALPVRKPRTRSTRAA